MITSIAFRINPDEKAAIVKDAEDSGINVSFILRRLVKIYLDDEELRHRVKCVEPRPIMKGEC